MQNTKLDLEAVPCKPCAVNLLTTFWNLSWSSFVTSALSTPCLKSGQQLETKRYQAGTVSSVTANVYFNNSSLLKYPLFSSCSSFVSNKRLLELVRWHLLLVCLLIVICVFLQTVFDRFWFDLRGENDGITLITIGGQSGFAPEHFTIMGVMCRWFPSGWVASLNGWKRVTGCRADALLMREPD